MVDDLQGKTIGFITCDPKFAKSETLQQIFKDLQKEDSNFMPIWIPHRYIGWLKKYEYGNYTRFIQCMPWATFPIPWAIWIDKSWCKFHGQEDYAKEIKMEDQEARFVVVDKEGQIAIQDALPLLVTWGVKFYLFIRHTIRESFLMESESCLEVLLQGMNIVERKPMKSKMTFLYVPNERVESQLEKLTQIHGSFEVLYVGKCIEFYKFNKFDFSLIVDSDKRRRYEDARGYMTWPSLSFSDMNMFWRRCGYLASKQSYYDLNKEPTLMIKKLRQLAKHMVSKSLVLVDNDGMVSCYDIVKMILESTKSDGRVMPIVKYELMNSLSDGEFTPFIKAYFRDEIGDLPQHPQHRIWYSECLIRHSEWGRGMHVCGVCDSRFCPELAYSRQSLRSYTCCLCEWQMCGRCWMAYCPTLSQI